MIEFELTMMLFQQRLNDEGQPFFVCWAVVSRA
jgi:hypothetical protein